MPHGNSHQNKNLHHLYEITDTLEDEVYKYGVSDDDIEEDGLSARLREQLSLFNLVANFLRFVGKILIRDIPGRKAAEQIEDEHMDAFEEKYGRLPRGNKSKNRKNR